jgi:hypothetical protein
MSDLKYCKGSSVGLDKNLSLEMSIVIVKSDKIDSVTTESMALKMTGHLNN